MRFVESFIIIWVDDKFDLHDTFDEETERCRATLHQIVNSVEFFDTCEKCISFINHEVKDEKIFLIVSTSLGQRLVLSIENDIRLDSIYIFSPNESKHNQWATREQHHKINGVYTNIEDLYQQLREDIKNCQHELTSIQTLGSHTPNITNHLDASFMYSQLLKEIIISAHFDQICLDMVKNDFVEISRNQYATNKAVLEVIEEFKQDYTETDAIWWYTRECFVYSMLNRALCTQHVEILMKMSFFIRDLHRQLEQMHKTTNPNQVLTVYRGQGMLPTAFDRLRQNQGGLISFNNFLSTSTSKEVSLRFVGKALRKPEKVGVLFEMIIDPSISSIPFASLDQLSYFEESEKEILFSMHTVFRIGEIRAEDKLSAPRLWLVQLISTNADDEQLHQLTEYLRLELASTFILSRQTTTDSRWRLAKLLINMGEYDKARFLWDIILEEATRENDIELVEATHFELAEFFMIYQNDRSQAKLHLKKIYSLGSWDDRAHFGPATDEMMKINLAIGSLFSREDLDDDEFYSIIADLLSELITLYLDHPLQPLGPLDYQLISDRYNFISWVRSRQGNLPEAWMNLERSLELLREYLPPTHPRLALTYYRMGTLHSDMNNPFCALDCLKKALDIQEKALQPHHPHLAESHFQLSNIFERLQQIDDAFEHAKIAVEIGRLAFLPLRQPPMKQYRKHYHRIRRILHSANELVL